MSEDENGIQVWLGSPRNSSHEDEKIQEEFNERVVKLTCAGVRDLRNPGISVPGFRLSETGIV